jgi:DNA polymerase III delta prime subunit
LKATSSNFQKNYKKQLVTMSRKISQETFDDVVRENMEEFDMESKEALADAISQFNKQGVDLSSIDISGGIGRQEVLDAIAALNDSVSGKKADAEVIESIQAVAKLCAKDHEYSARNRIFVMNNGGVNSLHLLIDPSVSVDVMKSAVDFLDDLSKSTGEYSVDD